MLVIVAQHLIILQQLLPLLRFDGYYVLTDLTGVPDILGADQADPREPRARAASPSRASTELKPWVRRVVTTYVALLVPAARC